jgi:hypothetical protein
LAELASWRQTNQMTRVIEEKVCTKGKKSTAVLRGNFPQLCFTHE